MAELTDLTRHSCCATRKVVPTAATSTGWLIPHYTMFSRIAGFGIRWDITPHWMVRADYERHQGTFILSTRENRDPGRMALS